MRLFLFSDPPIYKLLTGDLYHWVMYVYHLLTMVGMTHKVGTTNNVVVSTNKVAATQPSYWASEASPTLGCSIEISRDLYVIVINHMPGLCGIYKSRDTRAKPEWQGFMNRVQTEHWFITIL